MRLMTVDALNMVGLLHEGVVDEASWSTGLDALSDFFGRCGLLLGSMHSGREGFDLSGHRIDPAGVALIAGPMANPVDNPWVAAAPRLPLRQPVTIDDIGGSDVLQRSRLWAGFYLAFGYSQAIGTVLERQPERTDILMLARGEEAFVANELAVFDQLITHIARAWRMKRQMQALREQTEDLTAALDHLERGVIITAPDGTIRFANRAADRLLSEGDGIDATNGRVRATRSKANEELSTIIHRAAQTGIGKDDVAVDAVSLARASDVPFAVVAEPLAPGHSETLGHGRREGTILFVGDARGSRTPHSSRIAAIYNLTAAEAAIATTIVSGASVAEAAKLQGISENTAKTHLKAVYGKIGVTRQSQLVRRVLSDIGGLIQ
jgi:DNA-binding CsgD family transcriptional regulator